MTETTVDPRHDRKDVGANHLQDSGTVCRVERVGDVQREGNFVRVGAVAVKPLARDVDGGLAPIRRLDTQLERLENTVCAVRDEVNRHLARQATESFANGDRP